MQQRSLWTEREYAEYLRISLRKAQMDRVAGSGAPYLKIGKSVRYDPRVVDEWLREQTRHSTTER